MVKRYRVNQGHGPTHALGSVTVLETETSIEAIVMPTPPAPGDQLLDMPSEPLGTLNKAIRGLRFWRTCR